MGTTYTESTLANRKTEFVKALQCWQNLRYTTSMNDSQAEQLKQDGIIGRTWVVQGWNIFIVSYLSSILSSDVQNAAA